jgi:hypothetical protein
MMAEKQTSQWQKSSASFVDAYIDWVRDTAKWVLDPEDEGCALPVLISLQSSRTEREFFERLQQGYVELGKTAKSSKTEMEFLRELEGRLQHAPGKPNGNDARSDLEYSQFTVTMPYEALKLLQGDSPIAQLVHRITIAHKLPPHATRENQGGEATQPSPERQHSVGEYKSRKGSPVVMGIIDEGIAFANQRFRIGPGDSRVKYAWIQDGRAGGQVPYGLELTKAGIDKSLRECMSGGQVDEDLFYSKTGVVDFGQAAHKATARRAGHGTHVMDLACGYDEGASPTSEGKDLRPIVCVKLPTVTVADTSGLGLEYYVLDGVDYILRKARDIAAEYECGELPVVINFSSGILAGPRDGTHPIELAIDARIERRMATAPTDVVLPSGNSRLARLHARVVLPPGNGKNEETKKLEFRVLPDDRTCSYLEIWLPTREDTWTDDWMEITLKPPGGEMSEALVAGAGKRAIEWAPHDDVVLCKVYYEFIGPPTNRGRYLIALLPSALPDSSQRLAPFGTWTIQFKNRMKEKIDVEASIQWDDRPLGYPQNGRQSYFIDDRYQRFDEISGRDVEKDNESPIKRDGSINAIATGSRTIVVGGCLGGTGSRPVKYSSGGPKPPADRVAKAVDHEEPDDLERKGPDALARSDESYVHQGILAAGTRSGSQVVMNGTSVAAPQVARQIAEIRAAGITRPGREIVMTLGKRLNPLGKGKPPSPERVGSGRAVTAETEREIRRLDRLDE